MEIVRHNTLRIGVLVALTLVLAAVGVVLGTGPAGTQTPPLTQQLPWENPDGSLDYAGIPDSMETLDCSGRTVGSLLAPFDQAYRPTDPNGSGCTKAERRYDDDAEGVSGADS